MLENFQERYNNLNPNQKKAVDTIDGPVMVVAGPGTGKTEILAARTANIFIQKKGEVEPENILCLTYTDAATIAMRKRLIEFIGKDAYRVEIHTYHSFCNQIIGENLDYFGKRELDVLSSLEQVEYLEKIIDSFTPENPLFRSSGYYEVSRLKDLFNTMKSENWTKEHVKEQIKSYLDDLPKREQFIYKRANSTKNIKVGDIKEHKIFEEKKKMELLSAGVEEFPRYQALLKENGRYDYHDMILWVLSAFEKDEFFLQRYQEQFSFILVDEYQDTNGSQNSLLSCLIDSSDNPNVFVVGDDDQSIYRFQGANLKNIMNFYEKYSDKITSIALQENYRSSQNILDASKALIEENSERLTNQIPGLEKNLEAKNSLYKDLNVKPVILEYANTSSQEVGIIEKIKNLQSDGQDLSKIAVLYKEHKQAKDLIEMFEKSDLPFSVRETKNILEIPFIQNLIGILEYIQAEFETPYSASSKLFQILHYDFWKITALDVSLLLFFLRKNKGKKSFMKANDGNSNKPSLFGEVEKVFPKHLRDFVSNRDLLSGLAGFKNIEKISVTAEFLENWISDISNMTVLELFSRIINEGGILDWVTSHREQVWYFRVLKTFFDFIKQESSRNEKLSLKEFLSTVSKMQNYKIKIPVEKIFSYKDGVNFITTHSSKGLEFEYVFVIGCQRKVWDKASRNFGYSFPDTLLLSNIGDETQEQRRLLYVAMTRAKKELILSYSISDVNGKSLEKSQLMTGIEQKMGLKPGNIDVSDDKILHYQTLLLKENNSSITLLSTEYLNTLLENYKMSATHLNKYLRCPVTFYFENVLRVPQPKNEFMSFGTSVHYALEKFIGLFKERKVLPDLEELQDLFMKGMELERSGFTDEQYARKKEYGLQILKGYYEAYKDSFSSNVIVEYNVRNAMFGDIQLSGKIDKIEFKENKIIHIVDYKTGSYKNALSKIKKPTEKDPLGGDYFRQMAFYKVLLSNDPKRRWNMESGEFDFIEKDKVSGEYKKASFSITSLDQQIVEEQIREVYAKIMNHEFTEGCEDEYCNWCRR